MKSLKEREKKSNQKKIWLPLTSTVTKKNDIFLLCFHRKKNIGHTGLEQHTGK